MDLLEWLLVTTVPMESLEQAWQRVRWSAWHWLAEDIHHALKTGCRIEQRQMRSVDAMGRLLGILTPLALRVLGLRESRGRCAGRCPSGEAPDRSDACQGPVAHHRQLRGLLHNRKGDGPPGWKTLWRGWVSVQTVLQGVHLAVSFSPL